jgi:hypothetical protein
MTDLDMFYLIKRDDGYVFIQRYVPRDNEHDTFEVLAGPRSCFYIIQCYERLLNRVTEDCDDIKYYD